MRPLRLEVTGTESPRVGPRAPLWILEGKVRYADEHPDEEIFIVHVLNGPHLTRPVVRAIAARGLRERYPIQIKRPYGAEERYVVVPANAPELMPEATFFRWLKRQAVPYVQQRLPGF